MLLASVIIFVIARIMKDAKAFTRLMAILAVSALVGAGIKHSVSTTENMPEKATVVSTNVTPMQSNTSPFILESIDACLDSAGQETVTRDSVETQVEGASTELGNVDYIDDS